MGQSAPSETAIEAAWAVERESMVRQQIEARGVKDSRVLEAMRRIPRHLFIAADLQSQVYDDEPLPISEGQTISQPYIVALMTELLHIAPPHRLLEIGTGSGYQTAVLSALAAEVWTLELSPTLSAEAQQVLTRLGCRNVHFRVESGFHGWPEAAPFDGIMVTCAPREVPEALCRQLGDGGRLVIPVGERNAQQLMLVWREGETFHRRTECPVRFVPMQGENVEPRRAPA